MSSTKKILLFVIGLFFLTILCICVAFAIGINTISERLDNESLASILDVDNQDSTREENIALIGDDGPLATGDDSDLRHLLNLSYLAAVSYEESEEWELAVESIQQAYKELSDNEDVIAYRCYLMTGVVADEEAIIACLDALEQFPNLPSPMAQLVMLYGNTGRCEDVKVFADRLARLRMTPYYSDEDIGIFYGNAGIELSICGNDPELADTLLTAAIDYAADRLDKNVYEAYLSIDNEGHTGESLRGGDGLESYLGTDEQFVGRVPFDSALEHLDDGDWLSAKFEIEKAYELNQTSIDILDYRCYIYEEAESLENTISACQEAHDNYPALPDVVLALISSYYSANQCEKIPALAEDMAEIKMTGSYKLFRADYYAQVGQFLQSCELRPQLSEEFLRAAVDLSNDEEDKEFYESLLE